MSLVIILLCNQRFCVRDSHFDNQLGLQTSNVRFIRWFLSIYEILMYVFEFSEFSLFFLFYSLFQLRVMKACLIRVVNRF